MLDVEVFPSRTQEHQKKKHGTRYKDFVFRSRGCKRRCERERLEVLVHGRLFVTKPSWHRPA